MASGSNQVNLDDVWAEAKCPYCKNVFKDPRSLNCGHSICQSCIPKYVQTDQDYGFKYIICQIDTKINKFGKPDGSDLPKSHSLLAIIEALSKKHPLPAQKGSTSSPTVNNQQSKGATTSSKLDMSSMKKEIPGVKSESPQNRNQSATSKVEPVKRRCELYVDNANLIQLKDNPLLIYKVKPNEIFKDTDLNIRGCEIGTPIRGVMEKVIIFVGPTGSGKTTTINALTNYLLGVKFNDPYRLMLIGNTDDGGNHKKGSSQTSMVSYYRFYWSKGFPVPYTLTIVDTPGYGDTRGFEWDKKITEQIRTFFNLQQPKGIPHIDAVGFVIQAGDTRLTKTQKYVLNSMLSIFGADLKENIFLLTTFSDANDPPAIDAVKEARIEYFKYFKFNNSALYGKSTPINQLFWTMGEESISAFFSEINLIHSKSLHQSKDVMEERKEIECRVTSLRLLIKNGLNKLEEMRQELEQMKLHEAEIKANNNYTYQVIVVKEKRTPTSNPGKRLNTNCLICHITCDPNCSRSNDDRKNCKSFNIRGRCKVCPKHCTWQDHENAAYIYETYQDIETRNYDELKNKYMGALAKRNQSVSVIDQHRLVYQALKRKVLHVIIEIRTKLIRLETIALRAKNTSFADYIDLLIQVEQEGTEIGWQERVEQLRVWKKDAEMLIKLQDEGNLDPWEMYEKEMAAEFGEAAWGDIKGQIDEMLPVSNTY